MLEEVYGQISNYHESRKFIAKQLIRAARCGNVGLEDLRAVADNWLSPDENPPRSRSFGTCRG